MDYSVAINIFTEVLTYVMPILVVSVLTIVLLRLALKALRGKL